MLPSDNTTKKKREEETKEGERYATYSRQISIKRHTRPFITSFFNHFSSSNQMIIRPSRDGKHNIPQPLGLTS